MSTPSRPNWLIPALLALLFFGPLALAGLMYFLGGDAWRPAASTAHGILLPEPRSLPEGPIALADPLLTQDGPFQFAGRWSLILVGRGDCSGTCGEMLYRTRQVRRALGREMSRVQRVFVVTAGPTNRLYLATEHPGLAVLPEELVVRERVLLALGEFSDGDVFIADPLGNVIMRFKAGAEMKDMHKDLSLLLKASQIG